MTNRYDDEMVVMAYAAPPIREEQNDNFIDTAGPGTAGSYIEMPFRYNLPISAYGAPFMSMKEQRDAMETMDNKEDALPSYREDETAESEEYTELLEGKVDAYETMINFMRFVLKEQEPQQALETIAVALKFTKMIETK